MKKIGPIWLDGDSFFVGHPGKWVGVHIDHPWSQCVKEFGAPHRVNLNLGVLGFVLAGLPGREEGKLRLTKASAWHPLKGHHDSYRWITYLPPRWLLCDEEVGEPFKNRLGHTRRFHCGAIRRHPGPHRQPDPDLMERVAKRAMRRIKGEPVDLQFRCRVCQAPATASHTVEDDEGTTVSYYCLEHAPEGAVTE